MNKKDFIELTGEKPEDIMGNDWKNDIEDYGDCEKCGGETATKTVGDESADVCSSCGWITH
jgi:hypothetical protein